MSSQEAQGSECPSLPAGPAEPIEVEIRPADLQELYPLRREVLRPDLERLDFEDDEAESTIHLGAYQGETLVGILSVFREDFCEVKADENPASHLPAPEGNVQWRIRGIAVTPSLQKKGLGSKLLNACIDHVKERGARMLWFKARRHAQLFYIKHGFSTTGDVFTWNDVGEMVHMFKRL